MKPAAFFLFVIFSLGACTGLVLALVADGFPHLAPWAGMAALITLTRSGWRLFYGR